jgi:hypothetical protein
VAGRRATMSCEGGRRRGAAGKWGGEAMPTADESGADNAGGGNGRGNELSARARELEK